jgi:NADH-quinone oxidoreductase subunit C
MSNDHNLTEALNANFSGLEIIKDNYDCLNITSSEHDVHGLIEFLLKDLGFAYLTDLTGAHYPNSENSEFQVIYHLHNLQKNHRIRVRVKLPKSNPQTRTITDLFVAANWMERETYDFFGIIFEGHPNMVRILNMDDMDYFPMRKEYALEDETRTDKSDRYFGR